MGKIISKQNNADTETQLLNSIAKAERTIVPARSGLSRLLRGEETDEEMLKRITSNKKAFEELGDLFGKLLNSESGPIGYVLAHRGTMVDDAKKIYGIDLSAQYEKMEKDRYFLPGGMIGSGGFSVEVVKDSEANREIAKSIVHTLKEYCQSKAILSSFELNTKIGE
jgi:hypothetical protein